LRTPWTLLSSAFLHIGLMHLLFNMAALLSFGPLLERVLGWRRYVVLYALSALGGGMASALGHEVIVSAGASGALWGLMVGGAGLAVRPRDVLPRSVVGSMRKQVWTPVLINLVYSFQPRRGSTRAPGRRGRGRRAARNAGCSPSASGARARP
jgi:rhomboid protease GluP